MNKNQETTNKRPTVKSSEAFPNYTLACRVFENIDVKNLTQEEFEEIRKAVPQNGVILIKNQHLSLNELIAWTKRFGEPIELPDGLRFNNFHKEYPEVTRISNILPNGELLQNYSGAEYWHSDGDFWQAPKNYVFSCLYAEKVPPTGGETGFADLRLAYNNLSQELKDKIKNLRVWVSPKNIPDFEGAKESELPPDAYHNIAYLHPETKLLCLYFGCTASDIEGLNREDGQKLLKELMAEVEKNEHVYAHKWSPNDLLMWDNTSTMHRSLGGYGNYPRLMYRTQAYADVK